MKIFVLTNKKRQLDISYNQIDYIEYVDKTNDKYKCYIELLREIKDNNKDVLILEDDLILCKDFKNRIEEVIDKHPDEIINFFWKPYYKRNEIYTSKQNSDFCFTQCVYYPKGSINKFFNDLLDDKIQYDVNIGQALVRNKMSFIQCRPHLVQHIGDISLINPNSSVRRSNIFIDDIEKII